MARRLARGPLRYRGIMGYEGHAVGLEDHATRVRLTEESMRLLLSAHAQVGGEVISAGGTGTYAGGAGAAAGQPPHVRAIRRRPVDAGG